MAVEVTLVLRFEDEWDVPDDADIEDALDCIVLGREVEDI